MAFPFFLAICFLHHSLAAHGPIHGGRQVSFIKSVSRESLALLLRKQQANRQPAVRGCARATNTIKGVMFASNFLDRQGSRSGVLSSPSRLRSLAPLSCFDEKREMVVNDDELAPCPSQRGIERSERDLGGVKKTQTSSTETLEMVSSSEIVTSSGEESSQLTVNAVMLKDAKDLEIREMADRELNACTSKLDERCAEPDAAQWKLEAGIDGHDDVLSQVEVEHAKKEAKKAYLQYLLSLAGDEQKRTTHNYLVWIKQEVEKQKKPYKQHRHL